jgi:hypothetical protein
MYDETEEFALSANNIIFNVYNNTKNYYKQYNKQETKLLDDLRLIETKLEEVFINEKETVEENDVSGNDKVVEYRESSSLHYWIKLIPMSKTILFDAYNRKEHFIEVANVVLDKDLSSKGEKKRKTLIKFVPQINKKEYSESSEWLYLFLINNRIVKIGGTRTGLQSRATSYLCGHHIKERKKSGYCSKTNGFIYNTFEFYLNLDCKIKMMAYKLPTTEVNIDIFGVQKKINAQTFHAYESVFLEDYKKNFGIYPFLNDNCDPKYKKL